MVQKKILNPVRAKDIFYNKSFLKFNLEVPLCQGRSNSSDFIYNVSSYNDNLYSSFCFRLALDTQSTYFSIVKKIYNEAGRSIFADNAVGRLSLIPRQYCEPPIHISNYKFSSNLGSTTKNMMTMYSFHSPLNITFDTMAPLDCFFNRTEVPENWGNLAAFMSRIPIFVQYTNNKYAEYLKLI